MLSVSPILCVCKLQQHGRISHPNSNMLNGTILIHILIHLLITTMVLILILILILISLIMMMMIINEYIMNNHK